jgi:putative ABC transport system permease protein
MRSTALVRVALASILRNTMRSALTMLGIVIGVGAVILMVAIGQGAKSTIQRQIEQLGTNLIVITPGAARTAGVSLGAGTMGQLTTEDAEVLAQQSFFASAVSPVVNTFGQLVGPGGNWRAQVNGVSPDYLLIRDWPLEDGRFFDRSDLQAARGVAVIGQTVVENVFPDGDPVGQTIRIRQVPFTIIGVLARKGQTAEGRDQDDVVIAPYTTVRTRLSGRMFISQIVATTPNREDIPSAQEELRGILREVHGLTAVDDDDFTVRDQADLAETAQATTEVMTWLLAAIAGISLVVGGIGVMNIMLVSVTERTREIGIRMAVGARDTDILTQFLIESIIMSALGGVIGLAVGYGGSLIVARVTGWSTGIAPVMVALALGFAAAVGVFFGYYPAHRAARMDPIEALRRE